MSQLKKGPLLAGLALVFVISFGTSLFLRYFDRVEEERETPYSGEARTNPYYALELLYNQMSVPAKDVIGWHQLPPTDHTMMLLGERYTEADQRTEKLLEWVAQGGHLIVVPQGTVSVALDHNQCEDDEGAYYDELEEDELEEELLAENGDEDGVETGDGDEMSEELGFDDQPAESEEYAYWHELDADGDGVDDPVVDPISDPLGIQVETPLHDEWLASDRGIVAVRTESGTRRINVETSPGFVDGDGMALFLGAGLVSNEEETAPDQEVPPDGIAEFTEATDAPENQGLASAIDTREPALDRIFFLRRRHGKGLVTAITDSQIFTNEEIGQHDHAAFAWDLLSLPEHQSAGVWIVGRDRYPKWTELLRENAQLALLSGGLLLFVYLWNRGMRFGPPISAALPERRSVLEHIHATGDFFWRSRMGNTLLASTRRAALRRVENRDPAFATLGENEQSQYLSDLTGISGGQLRRALSDHGADDPTEFTRIVRTLEKLSRATSKS